MLTFRSFTQKTDGNFAVWFAVMAFPLVAATSLVIDYRTSEANAAGIKTALDTAVLAAVSNDSLDKKGKEALAEDVFNMHYKGTANLKLSPKAKDGQVEMTASGEVATSVGRAVGFNAFKVSKTSVAVMNRVNTICVLALAGDGKEKLRFLDETKFKSPTCSVQSNSKDPEGIISETKHVPKAKSFCSAGGAVGEFEPSMRGQCRTIADPYVTRRAPQAGVCMPTNLFGYKVDGRGNIKIAKPTIQTAFYGHEDPAQITIIDPGKHQHPHCHLPNAITGAQNCHVSNHKEGDVHAPSQGTRLMNMGLLDAEVTRLVTDYGLGKLVAPESINYTSENGVYYPGTYCGGLTVDGLNVTFMPGTYIIKDGPLTFKNGASASAQDVSFVLSGMNAVLTVETGSYVNVKAPRSGPMAGLAFYQDQQSSSFGLQKNIAPPTAVNLLSSGGELNVTGTMYFPTQALEVVGDSVLGAKAPATSFIAHQVTFSGKTKAEVQVDHVKGGIPPMLPRSDDGARLIQ